MVFGANKGYRYHIKQCLGAVDKHNSIYVTKRLIKTLEYEWLRRVAIFDYYDHLV